MTDEELLAPADAIAARAYSPYSKFNVGCAVLARDGTVFEGVNVENAAYPLGDLCREERHRHGGHRAATASATSR